MKEFILLAYANILSIRKTLVDKNTDGTFNTSIMLINDTTMILDEILKKQFEKEETSDGIDKSNGDGVIKKWRGRDD